MCWVHKCRQQAGFTLLEIIVTLMITGFIGVGLTYGVVYGVKLYRATVGIEETVTQAEVAMNVIAQQLRQNQNDRIQWNKENRTLMMNNEVLLSNVQDYSVTSINVPQTDRTLWRIQLSLKPSEVSAQVKTFEFDIYPEVSQ